MESYGEIGRVPVNLFSMKALCNPGVIIMKEYIAHEAKEGDLWQIQRREHLIKQMWDLKLNCGVPRCSPR